MAVERGAPAQWLARGLRDVPEHDNWLSTDEAQRLASLRFAKRRSELRLARWTAKLALARALGLDLDAGTLARLGVRPAPSGAPEAFLAGERLPVAVSSTDRADWAVCVVAPADLTVGCDLELIEPRSDAFVRAWFTPSEQALVADDADGPDGPDLVANLVWSAKESALKVLQTGLRRATRSVEVDVVDRDGSARWARLVVRTEEGGTFPGWWRRYGAFLLTLAATADRGPPASMETPPSLAGAQPSHRWLDDV